MNRIFHARVPWYTLFFLILLAGITIWAYWEHSGVLAATTLLLMVILIERTIHTTYTITTDGELKIHRGRFTKDVTIRLTDIQRIESIHCVRIGSICLRKYLLIHHADKKVLSLIPSHEEEFVKCIKHYRK